MQPPSTALAATESSLLHKTGHGHPERPERFTAVMRALRDSGLSAKMQRLETTAADDETLRLCHGADYVEIVKRDIASGSSTLSTGDTTISEQSLTAATEAVGAVIAATDAVIDGQANRAFCALRPPGHHARPDQGMGFCLFNNIAIGARHAIERRGLDRVLIVDWDVHHGNGTQDIFYEDPSVMFFSTHQAPWYPGTGKTFETGEGRGKGTTINAPFPAGAGREEVLGAFRDQLKTAAADFKPDLVMISAGFDSRLGDPLGGFRLTDDDFRELTELMLEVADLHAAGRVVSVLEGGYSLKGLAAGVGAHVKALL